MWLILAPRLAFALHHALAWIACASLLASNAAKADEPLFPGKQSTWNGFDRYDFDVDGKPALVVVPRTPAAGRPWVWHGEFFGHRPEPDIALLGRGFHVVYLRIPNLFGAPQAIEHWNAFYQLLTERHGLAPQAALVGVSRGGLYCYNWAAANPDRVACIYGDAPVCDLKSWPLGQGKGTGNKDEIPLLLQVHGVATTEELLAKAVSPIDNLAPLAKAKIPLLHVYGDADLGVPWEENTGLLAERYRAVGGEITLIAKSGVGHVHGLDDSTPIIEFIARHAIGQLPLARAPLQLGSQRELFVDRFLIERLSNAQLYLHEPRDEGPVLAFDKPWEGPHAGYVTMLRDGDLFRMYYRGISQLSVDGSEHERTCVAESADGVTWTKPKLGLFEFDGSKANNIVLAQAAPATHNFCPLLDTRPGVPASQRYKAVGGTGRALFAFVSADGLRWQKLRDEPILGPPQIPFPFQHLFDSQNLVFWSTAEQTYVCYFRVWDGLRRIARSTSPDFVTWSPAVMMEQRHDDGSGSAPRPAPAENLYTNQTAPYFRAPQIYMAFAARFFEGRQVLTAAQARAINVSPDYFRDTSDGIFMTSRGGSVYDRTFLEGFLKPGIGPENWVSRTNYPALNLLQTGPTELSLYANQDYAQPSAHVHRYSLRLDGIASLRAGASDGEMLTKPFVFSGSSLAINFATSAGGGLRFELQRVDGTPLPGFSLAESQEQIGNEIERVVTWQSGSDLSAAAGQPIRLRCLLRDADLFAIQFKE